MTRPRPLRRFDPFRPIDMLTALWSTAAVAPVSSGAAAAYRTLFTTVRRLVVGRRLAVRLDDGDLALTVTEFDSRLDVRGLSVGQLNDVRLAARDIWWRGSRFDRATAVLHNVHIKPTTPPVLVAAPVELTLEVHTLLHQLQPGEGVGLGEFLLDRGQPFLHRLGSAFAPSPGLVGLECFQISTDGSSLFAPLGQRSLVGVGHRGSCALRLGRHFRDSGRSTGGIQGMSLVPQWDRS